MSPPVPPIVTVNAGSLGAAGNGSPTNGVVRGQTGALSGSSDTAYGFSNPGWGVTYFGSHVDVPYNAALNPSGPFTIELWARPSSQAPDLFSPVCSLDAGQNGGNSREGYLIYYDGATSKWNFRIGGLSGYATGGGGTIEGGTVTPNTWHHVVGVYNGSSTILYVNGVQVNSGAVTGGSFVPNATQPFRIGATTIPNRTFDGLVDEVAFYSSALSASTIKAHFDAATTNGAGYGTQILASSPVGYWRLGEAGDPAAANLGSLGSAANGSYIYHVTPNQTGPNPSSSPIGFPGLEAGNKAFGFDGASGFVNIPALNLNTNTFSMTCWIKPNGGQAGSAGVFSTSGALGAGGAGIQFDILNPLDLTYNWNNDSLTVNWGSGITIPDGQWTFAALMVAPDKAVLYAPSTGLPPATNVINHAVLSFASQSFIGCTNGADIFNGSLDEVAVFNRTLGLGEAYSQYAAAVGGLGPQIFSDPQTPSQPVVIGDELDLFVDAGGTPALSYQWRKDLVTIPGATNAKFAKPNIQAGDAGSYDVIVTNAFGNVTSAAAVVTTQTGTAPVVTRQPISRTLYTGGTLNLTVLATGGGLKYQWKRSNTNLPGVTASSYIVASATTNNAGSYTVSVTNALGATNLGPFVITIPAYGTNTYEGQIIASAPEAWWRLDEGAGSTNLYDGMGRHDGYYSNLNSTVPPVTLGVAGALNNDANTAASFTRNGGFGLIPYSANLNNSTYTYEGWVKTADLSTYQVPFSSADANGGLWWAMVTGTTPVTWEPGGAGGYYNIWEANDPTPHSFTTLPTASGQWTHLVMTYDANFTINGTHYPWKFYVNGVTDGGFVWSLGANAINASGPFVIGGISDPSAIATSLFNGPVDEVAVYKRVLTATEITAHYNAGFTPAPPTFLVAFIPQTVTVGKSVTFTTTVQGTTPIALQWYKSGSLLAGATTNSLTIPSTAVADTGTYTLWATNSVGTNSQSVALTVIPAVGYANVTNGSVLHLRFDGNAQDSSGHNNHGTAVGSPAFVSGLIGSGAIQYSTTTITNGSSNPSNVTFSAASYVTLGTPGDLQFGTSTSFTIGLWAKLPVGFSGGDLPFIGTATGSFNNPGWDLGPTYGGGGWQWCLNDGVACNNTTATNNLDVNGAAGSINDGNWHNLVLSVDRSSHVARFYLDGVLTTLSGITALSCVDNGSAVTIGQDPTGMYTSISPASQNDLNVWGPLQTATLDDLGVWTRALTPLEVAKIESAGRNGGRSFDSVAPPVTLTAILSGANVVLSWSTGTLLQSSNLSPNAAWTPVPGATAPSFTVTPATGMKFYRVFVQ